MSVDTLHTLLQHVSAAEYENELSFVIDAVPQLVRSLGYSEHFLLFEYRLGRRYIADALVTASPALPARLLIEAKSRRFAGRRMLADGERQLREYQSAANSELAIMFAPHFLWVLSDGHIDRFNLETVTRDQVVIIYDMLKSPTGWPPQLPFTPAAPTQSGQITFHHFSVSRESLTACITAVEAAETNDEKGKSLEALAALLFGGISGVSVKYRNLLGASNEIDLVLEYNRTVYNPALDEFGRYSLVECKNWAVPVGAKHVRDFKAKLDKTQVKLGFLLARNGVTGAHEGADALREIHSGMDRDGIFIIVLALDDITAILNGSDFHQVIDDKIDRLRFDL